MLCSKLPVSSVSSSSVISCTSLLLLRVVEQRNHVVGDLNYGLAFGKLDLTQSFGVCDDVALDHPASTIGLIEGRGILRGGVGVLGNELNLHRSLLPVDCEQLQGFTLLLPIVARQGVLREVARSLGGVAARLPASAPQPWSSGSCE